MLNLPALFLNWQLHEESKHKSNGALCEVIQWNSQTGQNKKDGFSLAVLDNPDGR